MASSSLPSPMNSLRSDWTVIYEHCTVQFTTCTQCNVHVHYIEGSCKIMHACILLSLGVCRHSVGEDAYYADVCTFTYVCITTMCMYL